jgi:hypothetical protein
MMNIRLFIPLINAYITLGFSLSNGTVPHSHNVGHWTPKNYVRQLVMTNKVNLGTEVYTSSSSSLTASRISTEYSTLHSTSSPPMNAFMPSIGRLSKNSLTPTNLTQFSIYKSRGFQFIPKFSTRSKNPCFRVSSSGMSENNLPYFFLGVPKCGTTALYSMIVQHPHVLETVKEPHWWTRDQTNTKIQQYCLKYTNASKIIQRSLLASTSVPKKSNLIFGDASASTFWEFGRSKNLNTPTIPSQIHALLPHARLIVVFRNPTERCLSEYSYFIQNPNDLSATAFTELSLLRISNFNNCVSKVKNQNKASGTKYDEVIECMYFRHEELYYDQGTSNVNKKLLWG